MPILVVHVLNLNIQPYIDNITKTRDYTGLFKDILCISANVDGLVWFRQSEGMQAAGKSHTVRKEDTGQKINWSINLWIIEWYEIPFVFVVWCLCKPFTMIYVYNIIDPN